MEERLTIKQAKKIQQLIQEIDNLHPSIRRKLCSKLCDTFESVLQSLQIVVEGLDPVNRAKKTIVFTVYKYDQIGYLALYYFIKYYQTTLEFED